MADARKTWTQLDTLFANNTAGAISPQDLRDGFASLEPHVSASAPTTSDDGTDGYDTGHHWLVVVDDAPTGLYVCLDNTTSAAVWKKVWPPDVSSVDAADLGSGEATDGQVLTADGSGGAAWEAASGDMTKAVYDEDDDGTVDAADVAGRVEETVATDTDSTATHAIDCDNGTVHQVTLTANCTLSFSNVPTGGFGITLVLIQDGTGSRTATWPAAVKWAGGTAPTLSTGASDVDVIALFTPDGGATWYGFPAGLDMS